MNTNLKSVIEVFNLKNIKEPIRNIMITGIRVCFVLLLFATLLLSLYIQINPQDYLYQIGSSLFKAFSMFIVFFFVYGISFNKIV